jgi:hypothetical protein
MKFSTRIEGVRVTVNTDEGNLELTDLNRVSVYAEFEWNAKDFDLRILSYYIIGRIEGTFGLYPEANYGPNSRYL